MVCSGCELQFGLCGGYAFITPSEITKFLFEHGVIRREITCKVCGNKLTTNSDGGSFACGKLVRVPKKKAHKCSFRQPVRGGTFLSGMKIPVHKMFYLVAVLLHMRPPRQRFLLDEMGISSGTVVDWYSYCREVFIEHLRKSSVRLGGPGKTVQMDEAKFGRSKFSRGRYVTGQWAFGGICSDTRETFLVPVPNRDSQTLLAVIRQWISPGTTVVSDCWKAYDCLENEGFVQLTVNHTYNFVNPTTGAHANTIERVWREVRARVPKSGVRCHYLAEYLFKRKYDRLVRMHVFFRAAAELYNPDDYQG